MILPLAPVTTRSIISAVLPSLFFSFARILHDFASSTDQSVTALRVFGSGGRYSLHIQQEHGHQARTIPIVMPSVVRETWVVLPLKRIHHGLLRMNNMAWEDKSSFVCSSGDLQNYYSSRLKKIPFIARIHDRWRQQVDHCMAFPGLGILNTVNAILHCILLVVNSRMTAKMPTSLFNV